MISNLDQIRRVVDWGLQDLHPHDLHHHPHLPPQGTVVPIRGETSRKIQRKLSQVVLAVSISDPLQIIVNLVDQLKKDAHRDQMSAEKEIGVEEVEQSGVLNNTLADQAAEG